MSPDRINETIAIKQPAQKTPPFLRKAAFSNC